MFERPSWKVRKNWEPGDLPCLIIWGGAEHNIAELIYSGWTFVIETNRFTKHKRLIATMPEADNGTLYSLYYYDLVSKQQQVTISHFVPRKLEKAAKQKMKLELMSPDLSEIDTATLLELITERLKAETPEVKPKAPPSAEVIELITRQKVA